MFYIEKLNSRSLKPSLYATHMSLKFELGLTKNSLTHYSQTKFTANTKPNHYITLNLGV